MCLTTHSTIKSDNSGNPDEASFPPASSPLILHNPIIWGIPNKLSSMINRSIDRTFKHPRIIVLPTLGGNSDSDRPILQQLDHLVVGEVVVVVVLMGDMVAKSSTNPRVNFVGIVPPLVLVWQALICDFLHGFFDVPSAAITIGCALDQVLFGEICILLGLDLLVDELGLGCCSSCKCPTTFTTVLVLYCCDEVCLPPIQGIRKVLPQMMYILGSYGLRCVVFGEQICYVSCERIHVNGRSVMKFILQVQGKVSSLLHACIFCMFSQKYFSCNYLSSSLLQLLFHFSVYSSNYNQHSSPFPSNNNKSTQINTQLQFIILILLYLFTNNILFSQHVFPIRITSDCSALPIQIVVIENVAFS